MKKLLLGAVVVMGFGAAFTSCVDDTESQAVTNIRNMKSEQLKAMAELNNATAEAALTLANAEKAAQEGDAAYKLAQANYNKAMAAWQNAQTDAEKQKLAITLEELQVDLDKAKAELQRILASVEKNIAQYKYNAAMYENEYNKIIAGNAGAKNEELKELLGNYKEASDNLIEEQRKLARATVSLAQLENNLVSLSENINNNIANLEKDNADYQIKIDENKAIIATYEKYAGQTVTQDEVNAARLKYVEADAAAKEAQEAAKVATADRDELWSPIQSYGNIAQSWNYEGFGYPVESEGGLGIGTQYVNIREVSENNTSAPANARGKICLIIEDPNNSISYVPVISGSKSEQLDYEYTLGENTATEPYTQWSSYYDLIDNAKGLETFIKEYENAIAAWTSDWYSNYVKENYETAKTNQATAQAAYDKANKDHAAAKAELEKAEAAKDAAYKAWEDAADDAKDAEWTKYEAAEDKYNEAVTKESEAQSDFYTARYELSNANNNLNNWSQQYNYHHDIKKEEYANKLQNYKDKLAETLEAAKEADLTAWNKASEAGAEAVAAENQANDESAILRGQYTALNDALQYRNGIVVDNWTAYYEVAAAKSNIESYETSIKNNEESIKQLKAELEEIESGDHNTAEYIKERIENQKAYIEKLKVAVEVAQKKFDMAKAELEAAIKDGESAE